MVAAFSAGWDGVGRVGAVEPAAASCPGIADARPLPAARRHDLSRADPAALILAVAVVAVGVDLPAAAAAAAVAAAVVA